MSLKAYNSVLKDKFGYETLKPQQFEILKEIVENKKDVLAILATGFGKSICYQMPYLLTKKCVIVISPLIALMADQTSELKKLKIPSVVLNSTCKNKNTEIDNILDDKSNNMIIYTTPEYFINCQFFVSKLTEQNRLCCIAVDEAHCVSVWGLDFRKSYTEIDFIKDITDVPVLSLTATASEKVRHDIIKILKLKKPCVILGDFDRPNLFLEIRKKKSSSLSYEDIVTLLQENKNEYVIIYCKTRSETEKLSDFITLQKIKNAVYHAGLPIDDRNTTQQNFISGKVKCIIATVAFGMGINVKNIRLVIHNNCPKNIESYYQEIGRAGRDGLPAKCVMFYSKKDFVIERHFLNEVEDSEQKTYQSQQINVMEKYVLSGNCRRKELLKTFDNEYEKDGCDNCDNCCYEKPVDTQAKKDFSYHSFMLLELIQYLGGNYGVSTYVNVLRGSHAKNIDTNMKGYKNFGQGKNMKVVWWKELAENLLNDGYIESKIIVGFSGTTITCTEKGIDWIKKINNLIKKNNINVVFDKLEDETKIKMKETVILKTTNGVNESIFSSDEMARLGVGYVEI